MYVGNMICVDMERYLMCKFVRYYARYSLNLLLSHPDFDKTVSRVFTTQQSLSKCKEVIENLKNKVSIVRVTIFNVSLLYCHIRVLGIFPLMYNQPGSEVLQVHSTVVHHTPDHRTHDLGQRPRPITSRDIQLVVPLDVNNLLLRNQVEKSSLKQRLEFKGVSVGVLCLCVSVCMPVCVIVSVSLFVSISGMSFYLFTDKGQCLCRDSAT